MYTLYMISVSDGDFDAVFPNRSPNGYIMVDSLPVTELSEFTVSIWAKGHTCSEKHTLLIYSSQSHEKEIFCWKSPLQRREYASLASL